MKRIHERPVRMALVLVAILLAAGCTDPGSIAGDNTVALIPGYQGGGGQEQTEPAVQGYPADNATVEVSLGENSPQDMFINMSQAYVPEGTVSFIVSNDDDKKHEFVVLQSDTPADQFPVVSFEGEDNRIDEDAKGVVNVGETGDMAPGAKMVLTLDLSPGHYAVVCNLPQHYGAGMRQDFWVTPDRV